MGLSKTIVLTVKGFEVTLSEAIGFYKNDAVKLKFNINEYGIDVTQSAKVRTVMPINPLSAKLRIDLPTGAEELESVGIVDNQVEFYLSSKYTRHIGISTMQIRLLDNDGCQVTLPSFTFEIQDSMFRDDEVVVEAVTMLVDEEGHYLVDEKGNVVKVGSTGESKEIRDFTLKPSVDGAEDVLIQDNGVTKRVKASSLKGQQGIQGPKGDKGDPGTTTWEGITNKPTNLATESFVVQKIAEASLSGGEVDLSGYATKDDLDTKADNVHTHVMTDITDLVIPDIDVDKNYVDTQLATKANITDIPTKVSELTNDSGYLTAIPEEYVTDTELESKGYLTEHQDISNLATKAEVQNKADVNHTHSQYLTTIPTEYITETELNDALSTKANTSDIPSLEGYATESYVQNKIAEASLSGGEVDLSDYVTKNDLNTKADKKHTHTVTDITDLVIPTNTSDLTNDSGFITAIPDEYITETELTAKGYLVHSDIAEKANISDLSAVAISGDYNDLINTPTIPDEYILPIASATTLGGIKVGSGLSIDRYGVLSATGTGGTGTGGTGTGGTAGNGIIFNNSYIADCNRWLSNGYVKTNTSTLNLPALCTGVDRWGILFFVAENATNGTGTQMYFPVDGTYKGRVFTRSLTAMSQSGGKASEWVLLTIQSDIPTLLSQLTNDSGFVKASELSPVALSGNYNDLINKPTISDGGNVSSEAVINTKSITIDLDKYGIVEGDLSHKAPYSDEEYEIAYNNMDGFKTALNDLSSQGYHQIYLPKGTYIMCYRNPGVLWTHDSGWGIMIPSNVEFNLNGSTIKVIFDSDNKNPYDTTSNKPSDLGGNLFIFSKSYYSTLKNGIILGDRYERSFNDSTEKSRDYTYGIHITNGSSHCKIEDIDISGFMGDAINSNQNHNTDFGNSIVYTNVTFTNSSLSTKDGSIESKPASNYVFTSDYIDLSSIVSTGCRAITLRTNLGYTYVFDADVSFKVFLYDENQTFIKFDEYDQTDNIPLTSNTKYCKISLVDYDKVGESTISPVFQLSPTSPEFLHITNCKIYNNHRGGISNLPNDSIVEFCEIFENGTAGTEGFPVFTDTTRYAINCEDHMIRNLVVKNNYIHDGYNGILLTCKNAVITENVIKNFPTSSVYSMHASNIIVSNNKFENTKIPTKLKDKTKIIVSNNFYVNVSNITVPTNMFLNNNNITMKRISITNSGQLSLNLGIINEELSTNSVNSYGGIQGSFNNTIFNCVNSPTYFDVIDLASNSSNNIINYSGLAKNRSIKPLNVYNTTLTNGCPSFVATVNHLFNLVNSTINFGANSWNLSYAHSGGDSGFNFKNCIINITEDFTPKNSAFIFTNSTGTYDNTGILNITFDGCEININNNSVYYLVYLGLLGGTSFTRLNLTIKNCVINNNTSNTLKLFFDGNNHLMADYCTLVVENNTYNGNVVQS